MPGPNALAFIEHALAVLAGTDLTGPGKPGTLFDRAMTRMLTGLLPAHKSDDAG